MAPTEATDHSVANNAVTSSSSEGAENHLGNSVLARYLLVVLLPTIILYFLPFAFIRTPNFEKWVGSAYGPALDFAFQTAGQNADILIYSDSSALYGINPRIMSDEIGLKCLNLPNTAGSLPITGEVALKQYLTKNAPPKLIVFYFTPWDLDYSNGSNLHIFEGEEMILRHGSGADIWDFVSKHVAMTLQFPFQYYSLASQSVLLRRVRHQDPAASVVQSRGHIDAQKTHVAVTSPCTIPNRLTSRAGFDTAKTLVSRYTTAATQTLIFVAPIPACSNADIVLRRPYSELHAAPPREMAPELYLQDENYAHLYPKAVPEATGALISAVRAKLHMPSGNIHP